MGKYKTLLSNTIIFAISTVLSKIVLSLLLPLYTRFLSTEQYGIAELLTSISQLLYPISSLAIHEAIFRFSMDKSYRHEDVLKTSFFATIIGTIALFLNAFIIKFYKPISQWSTFFFWISLLPMVRIQFNLYVKAIEKTVIFAIDNVVYNGTLGILNIVFLVGFKSDLNGYFGAIIVANVISIFYLLCAGGIIQDYKKGVIDRLLFKRMLVYSSPLVLNSISWGLTHLTDKIMLTIYCSSGATGIYSAASKIPSVLSLVTGVFSQAWTLSAIRDYQEEKDFKFYENVFFLTHYSVSIIALIVFSLNNNVLLWIVGSSFAEITRYVPVLIIATIFLTYVNFYTPIYSAVKRSNQLMYSSFMGMIINVSLNYYFIPSHGIMGACIATAVSYAFIAAFRAINSRKYMAFQVDLIKWVSTLTLIIISGVAAIIHHFEVVFSISSILFVSAIYWNRLTAFINKAKLRSKQA